MAINTQQVSVGATAVKIVQGKVNPIRVYVSNYDHGSSKRVFIGGPNVSAINGFEVGEYPFDITLTTGTDLFAIAVDGISVNVGVFGMDI